MTDAGLPMIGLARHGREAIPRSWNVDGGRMHGLEWASDPTDAVVLAVHGINANATAWSLVADRIPGTRILAPDLRGRGRSNALPGPWSISRLADDLVRLLDEEGIERAVVAGHALGAFTGVRLAERYPDRVEALVLVNGGLPVSPERLQRFGAQAGDETGLGTVADASGDASVDASTEWAFTELTEVRPTLAAHRDAWRAHPAFGRWWNPAMEHYIDAGLQPAPAGGFEPAAVPAAIQENATELDGGQGYADALLALRTTLAFIRSPRGYRHDAPIYTPEHAEDWVTRIAGIANVEADATNHYTVLLSPHGADVTAAVIRGVVEIAVARARARAAHPATGRLRVVPGRTGPRPVD